MHPHTVHTVSLYTPVKRKRPGVEFMKIIATDTHLRILYYCCPYCSLESILEAGDYLVKLEDPYI